MDKNYNISEGSDGEPLVLIPSKTFKEIIKKKNEYLPNRNNFFDISINNLVLTLATNYKDIMNEIIDLFSSNNVLIIDDEHIGNLNKFKYILTGIIDIITKENRLIFVGILLLIISFFLYFVDISSK